jgi:hypothetical protein
MQIGGLRRCDGKGNEPRLRIPSKQYNTDRRHWKQEAIVMPLSF